MAPMEVQSRNRPQIRGARNLTDPPHRVQISRNFGMPIGRKLVEPLLCRTGRADGPLAEGGSHDTMNVFRIGRQSIRVFRKPAQPRQVHRRFAELRQIGRLS